MPRDSELRGADDRERRRCRPHVPLRSKAKQQLLTEGIEGLQKRLKKGKGVTKVLVEERQRQVRRLSNEGSGGGSVPGAYVWCKRRPGRGGCA